VNAGRVDANEAWDGTWEGARARLLKATLAATPAQRLAWLEEMLELAYRTGALGMPRPPDTTPPYDPGEPR
jgi:hypothetical protein